MEINLRHEIILTNTTRPSILQACRIATFIDWLKYLTSIDFETIVFEFETIVLCIMFRPIVLYVVFDN